MSFYSRKTLLLSTAASSGAGWLVSPVVSRSTRNRSACHVGFRTCACDSVQSATRAQRIRSIGAARLNMGQFFTAPINPAAKEGLPSKTHMLYHEHLIIC